VNNSIVTKAIVTEIVAERTRNEKDIINESVQLLNASVMPRLQYDIMRKQFNQLEDGKHETISIHAERC